MPMISMIGFDLIDLTIGGNVTENLNKKESESLHSIRTTLISYIEEKMALITDKIVENKKNKEIL